MQFSEKLIDLHVHSTESDGTLTPEALIALAKGKNLAAMALTDHDTVSGLAAARLAARDVGIELVPGIELSTDYNGTEVHMLGYYIDDTNFEFLKKLEEFCSQREERNKKMVRKLQDAGFAITYEDLLAAFPDSVLTRAHFARFLVDRGLIRDMDTVFRKYIGNDCSCYVPREKVTPFEAIELIHAGGGLAFFAHPVLCHMNHDRLDAFVKSLKEHGLNGLEAIYSTYLPGDERNIKRLAGKYDLLISGGSDFHGSNKPHIQLGTGKGNLKISYNYLQQIKTAVKRRLTNR